MRGRLAAVLLIPASAAVQELPLLTSPAAPGCKFESSFIRDTIDFTLFLTPPSSVAKARSQREQYSPYIHAVASTYQQPGRLSISYWPGGWADDQIESKSSVGDCDAWCSVGPLKGEVQFQLTRKRVDVPSGSWCTSE